MDALKALAALLGLGAAACAVLLALAGGGDGRWEHDGVLVINRPKAMVYEWLTEGDLREQWVPNVEKSREPDELEKGARIEETLVIDGRRVERSLEITEHELEELVAFKWREGDDEMSLQVRLSAHTTGKRTRVEYTCTAQYAAWWAIVLEPVLGWSTNDELEASFDALKLKIEQGYG